MDFHSNSRQLHRSQVSKSPRHRNLEAELILQWCVHLRWEVERGRLGRFVRYTRQQAL